MMNGSCARDGSGQEDTPQMAPVLLKPFDDAGTSVSSNNHHRPSYICTEIHRLQ